MKKLRFNLRTVTILIAMLMALQLITAQNYQMIVSADGTETTIAIADVQDIVFDNSTMTINMTSGNEITGVTNIKFSELSRIEKQEINSSVFVYPNPVREYLTVSGLEKNEKINLFDVTGKLLQTVFSKENSTEIDVLSLQEGVYLLQVGYKTIKFIKQ